MSYLSRQFSQSRAIMPLGLITILAVCIGSVSGRAQAMAYATPASSGPATQDWQTRLAFRTPNLTLGNAVAYDRANAGPLPDALPFPSALTTVDQQNTTGGSMAVSGQGNGTTVVGVGQSFTPTQTTMNAATISIYSYTSSVTVTLYVYAGSGFGGTLLATGTPVTITNTAFQNVELTLPTPLTLTPGSVYTLRASDTAGQYEYSYSPGDVYSGGVRYSSTGTAQANDLAFSEGFDSSVGAVPEPSTWLLSVLVSVWGVVTLRRRARCLGPQS